MTNKKAIKILREKLLPCVFGEWKEAVDAAISALEKQIPKELIAEGDGYADGSIVYDIFYCPSCDHRMEEIEVGDYCPNCGQKICLEGE